MKVKIKVKKEHIACGVMEDCSKCPIALAIRAVIKPQHKGRVEVCALGLDMGIGSGFITLPKIAIRFINRFDEALSVKPLTFTIDIPNGFLK